MQVITRAALAGETGDAIVHTGPGTPAGRYLRQFWQPIYHSVDLKQGRPIPLRILGESFALYRGETGAFLFESRCPHRGTQLSNGWVEGDSLRCLYHGWKFASDGTCTEQPADESKFCKNASIKSYPVREYLGLIFAFLGEGEAPEFPRYPEFERFEGLVEVDSYSRNCNYFQNLENALDMSHVWFTHGDNDASFDGIGLGSRLSAEESDWGVTYTFTREDGQLRVQQFGMPNIFYMTALPTDPDIGWQESLFWWVPIDDMTHMQFSLHRVPVTAETKDRIVARREARRSEIDLPHQEICEKILTGQMHMRDVDRARVDLVRLQDDLTQVGQGVFADRDAEKLGRADVGVAVTRRLWHREMNAFQAGRPLKTWTRSEKIVPTVWGLGARTQRLSSVDQTLGKTSDEAPVIDIRPFVEVAIQLKSLHGGPAR
jgi:5,5'-dehydrodivanillate O-demethylase